MYADPNIKIENWKQQVEYSNLSLTVYFDDADIVSELEFGNDFKGSTFKGLRIGDTLEKAIEIYGNPRMKSAKGAGWEKLKVFCNGNVINKIKVQR
jgi:hypothetical protein